MKKLTALIITLAFLSSYAANPPKNHLVREGLKGNIKSIKETHYSPAKVLGITMKKKLDYMSSFSVYNEKGDLIEYTYRKNQEPDIFMYIFDDEKSQYQVKSLGATGGFKSNNTYTYDANGNITKLEVFDWEGNLQVTVAYTYDERGYMTEYMWYNTEESPRGTHTYIYDDKGNVIEHRDYDSSGNIMKTDTYTYIESNNVISEKQWYINGVFKEKYVYTYDDKGNHIKEKIYCRNDKTGKYKLVEIVKREIAYY